MSFVSVVLIGRNEGERLRRCIESVQAMDRCGFGFDVIYVDSGSSDGSVELAEKLGVRTLALRPDQPTAALGRNAGWRAATGEFVLFLDGDTVLAPGFVRQAIEQFTDIRVAAVWGHRRELNPESSVYNRVLDLDWIYLPGPSRFCGGDALFRRSVLESAGGFDATLIAGEEPELCRRLGALGFIIQHIDVPMTGHDLAITQWSQYWRRSTRAGHAYAEVSHRFSSEIQPFWEAEAAANRRRASIWLALATISVALSVADRSGLPLLLTPALLVLLASRTAWKSRWKSRNVKSLLMYGLHSHIQQIPIFFGQLQFRRNLGIGRRTALVEYK